MPSRSFAEPWDTATPGGQLAAFYDLVHRAGGFGVTRSGAGEPLPTSPSTSTLSELPPDRVYQPPLPSPEWQESLRDDLRSLRLDRFSNLEADLRLLRRRFYNAEFKRQAAALIRLAPLVYSHFSGGTERAPVMRLLERPDLAHDRMFWEIFYNDYYTESIEGPLTSLEQDVRGLGEAHRAVESNVLWRGMRDRALAERSVAKQRMILRRIHPAQAAFLPRLNISLQGLPSLEVLARDNIRTYLLGKGDKSKKADQGVLVVASVKMGDDVIPQIIGISGKLSEHPADMARLAAMVAADYGSEKISIVPELAGKFQGFEENRRDRLRILEGSYSRDAKIFPVPKIDGSIGEEPSHALQKSSDLAELPPFERYKLLVVTGNEVTQTSRPDYQVPLALVDAPPSRDALEDVVAARNVRSGNYLNALGHAFHILHPDDAQKAMMAEIRANAARQIPAGADIYYVFHGMQRMDKVLGGDEGVRATLARVDELRDPNQLRMLAQISRNPELSPEIARLMRQVARPTCRERARRLVLPAAAVFGLVGTGVGGYHMYGPVTDELDRWWHPRETPLPDLSCEERGGKVTHGPSGLVGCYCPDGKVLHESREARCDDSDVSLAAAKFEAQDAEIYDLLTSDLMERGWVTWGDKQHQSKELEAISKHNENLRRVEAHRHSTDDHYKLDPAEQKGMIVRAQAAAQARRQSAPAMRAAAYAGLRERYQFTVQLYKEGRSFLSPEAATRLDGYLRELQEIVDRIPDPKTLTPSMEESEKARELLGALEDWHDKINGDKDKMLREVRRLVETDRDREYNRDLKKAGKELREAIEEHIKFIKEHPEYADR